MTELEKRLNGKKLPYALKVASHTIATYCAKWSLDGLAGQLTVAHDLTMLVVSYLPLSASYALPIVFGLGALHAAY